MIGIMRTLYITNHKTWMDDLILLRTVYVPIEHIDGSYPRRTKITAMGTPINNSVLQH